MCYVSSWGYLSLAFLLVLGNWELGIGHGELGGFMRLFVSGNYGW